MKLTFFLMAMLVAGLSYSQETIPTPQKRKSKVIYPPYNALSKDRLYSLPPARIGGPAPEAKLLHTLPNGNLVYALPQDNMPCIVPNESHMAMPNTVANPSTPYNYKGPDAIPNPAKPIIINPKKDIQKK
jgi:hypothetical protein